MSRLWLTRFQAVHYFPNTTRNVSYERAIVDPSFQFVSLSNRVSVRTEALLRRHGFLLGLLAVGFFKLWIVHTEEIYGSSAEYDHLWYVGSAKHWYWGAPYSWTAFVRPCAYPLFIAVVHFFGIPLRVAIELAQMAEDSGLTTLAYLFRMAALEASTANSVLAEPDDLPRQMTSH